jgi:hypothetical protein
MTQDELLEQVADLVFDLGSSTGKLGELWTLLDANAYECDGCGKSRYGDPALTEPPGYNSADGLGRAYCSTCAADI